MSKRSRTPTKPEWVHSLALISLTLKNQSHLTIWTREAITLARYIHTHTHRVIQYSHLFTPTHTLCSIQLTHTDTHRAAYSIVHSISYSHSFRLIHSCFVPFVLLYCCYLWGYSHIIFKHFKTHKIFKHSFTFIQFAQLRTCFSLFLFFFASSHSF